MQIRPNENQNLAGHVRQPGFRIRRSFQPGQMWLAVLDGDCRDQTHAENDRRLHLGPGVGPLPRFPRFLADGLGNFRRKTQINRRPIRADNLGKIRLFAEALRAIGGELADIAGKIYVF